jgi:hypothetical protein
MQTLAHDAHSPVWLEKAKSLSVINEERAVRARAEREDSEWHEQLQDDSHLSSLFCVHDPSICQDRSQKALDWKKFTEERALQSNTILDDTPEDRSPKFPPEKPGNPLNKLSSKTLQHLVNAGDKRAKRILDLRELPKKLGCEIVIEKGVILENGTLKVDHGWASGETAEWYRKEATEH